MVATIVPANARRCRCVPFQTDQQIQLLDGCYDVMPFRVYHLLYSFVSDCYSPLLLFVAFEECKFNAVTDRIPIRKTSFSTNKLQS